jgi:WD40 repeat protein
VLPDGLRALSIGGRGDNALRLWDLATGRELKQVVITEDILKDHPTCVAVSPGGDRAVVGCMNGTLVYFDLEALRELRREPHPRKKWITDVAFSPDGTFVISAGLDGVVRRWSPPGEGGERGGAAPGPGGVDPARRP